ncbi:MAG TPA: hypothetical protein VFD73_15795, partial [Gemmatimonadales bacterium]|nr:hypothetical protein [Gemmatimonadales bacterium]
MRYNDDGALLPTASETPDASPVPLMIASILRGDGITGVHTHVRQLRRYLQECGEPAPLITPFSWSRMQIYP